MWRRRPFSTASQYWSFENLLPEHHRALEPTPFYKRTIFFLHNIFLALLCTINSMSGFLSVLALQRWRVHVYLPSRLTARLLSPGLDIFRLRIVVVQLREKRCSGGASALFLVFLVRRCETESKMAKLKKPIWLDKMVWFCTCLSTCQLTLGAWLSGEQQQINVEFGVDCNSHSIQTNLRFFNLNT